MAWETTVHKIARIGETEITLGGAPVMLSPFPATGGIDLHFLENTDNPPETWSFLVLNPGDTLEDQTYRHSCSVDAGPQDKAVFHVFKKKINSRLD